MPRSSLAREPEPERDFLERLDPDFVERLDPEPPPLLFLLSAIRDHPVHHLLYGEIPCSHPLRLQTRVRLPETAGPVRPLRRDVLSLPGLEANAVPARALSSVQLDALARKWVEA
jgi:hypothetical protein